MVYIRWSIFTKNTLLIFFFKLRSWPSDVGTFLKLWTWPSKRLWGDTYLLLISCTCMTIHVVVFDDLKLSIENPQRTHMLLPMCHNFASHLHRQCDVHGVHFKRSNHSIWRWQFLQGRRIQCVSLIDSLLHTTKVGKGKSQMYAQSAVNHRHFERRET